MDTNPTMNIDQPAFAVPEAKRAALDGVFHRLGRVAVAFSGGVDSSLVLRVAVDCLGASNVLAVTVASPVHPGWEREEAEAMAQALAVEHLIVESDELENEAFVINPADRCYICKFGRFSELTRLARERGFTHVLDGGNADDVTDYRPGQRAADELGVLSPLKDAGFTKADIRSLSRLLGLPTWDRPSRACLASRFPYGERITREALWQVDQAETLLLELGIRQMRVRHHGNLARIELLPEDFGLVMSQRARLVARFKELGFNYVTLDLAGFRSGSMNEVL
jgi:pyridinium-3,5-biscarboxylic acid mononucleotide sulfurtransferase